MNNIERACPNATMTQPEVQFTATLTVPQGNDPPKQLVMQHHQASNFGSGWVGDVQVNGHYGYCLLTLDPSTGPLTSSIDKPAS